MAKPILAFLATNVRNYAAREVESKALIADSNLWTIWILNSFHRGESLAQCSNLSGRVVEAMTDGIQLTLNNKRFISLNVYDNVPVAANLLDSFFDAVGTALMKEVLREVTQLPQSSLEIAESLEQLRWLQNGYKIKVGTTDVETVGIDTPEDLQRAEEFLKEQAE